MAWRKVLIIRFRHCGMALGLAVLLAFGACSGSNSGTPTSGGPSQTPTASVAYPLPGGGTIEVKADEVVLKFKPTITPAERQAVLDFLTAHNATIDDVIDDVPEWPLTVVKVDSAALISMINALAGFAGIQFAYPNPIMFAQYEASPLGFGCGDKAPGCDLWLRRIRAQEAWDKTTGIVGDKWPGISPVSMLVIDHSIGNNPLEGSARFIKQVDEGSPVQSLYKSGLLRPFLTKDNVEELASRGEYLELHGTQAATVMGAPGNDGKGSAGLVWGGTMWGANIRGNGFTEGITETELTKIIIRVIESINTQCKKNGLVDCGGLIVNISLAPKVASPGKHDYSFEVLAAAILQAAEKDALLVFSAGNDKITNFDSLPLPEPSELKAGYNLRDYVLFVGGVDTTGEEGKPIFTRGKAVEIAAPAVNIGNSLVRPENKMPQFRGTSASAPIVAGAAALVKSLNPSFTAPMIKSRLMATACPVAGVKMLNVWRAVDPTVSEETACTYSAPPPRTGCVVKGDPATGVLDTYINCARAIVGVGDPSGDHNKDSEYGGGRADRFLDTRLAHSSATAKAVQTGDALPIIPVQASAVTSLGGYIKNEDGTLSNQRESGIAGATAIVKDQWLTIYDPAKGTFTQGEATLRVNVSLDWASSSGALASITVDTLSAMTGNCDYKFRGEYFTDPASGLVESRLFTSIHDTSVIPNGGCLPVDKSEIWPSAGVSIPIDIPIKFLYGYPVQIYFDAEAGSGGGASAEASITIVGLDIKGGLGPNGDILVGNAAAGP